MYDYFICHSKSKSLFSMSTLSSNMETSLFSGYRQCESSGSKLSCSMALLSSGSKYQAFKKEISCVKIKSEKRG